MITMHRLDKNIFKYFFNPLIPPIYSLHAGKDLLYQYKVLYT